MRLVIILSAALVALAFGSAMAADPAPLAPAAKPGDAAGAAAPPVVDERQKLLESGALMIQGKYDEAIEAAKGLVRNAKEEATRTDAARVVAESLRKKGEWRTAAAAYMKLRDRYEKGSDNFVKNEAISEILTASPAGLYPPLEAAAAKSAPSGDAASASTSAATATPAKPAANLADDDYLARAIACLAAARIEKLKGRASAIKRARTPQEAEALFAALAEELRQAQSLASSGSGEAEKTVADAANARLADLGKQIAATLNAKLAEFQAAIRSRSLTLTQRKEMETYQTACTELAKNEAAYQAATAKLTNLSDGSQLRNESDQREAEYARLARGFEPPPINTNHSWGGYGGGYGGGAPGGGGGGGWGGGGGGGGGGGRGG